MALFTTNGINYSAESVDGYNQYTNCTNFMEAALMCLQETTAEYDAIDRGLRLAEINYIKENGTPMVYTEASVEVIIKNALDALATWFKKIMALINNFITEIRAKIAGVKANILKKHGNTIKNFDVKNWKSDWDFDGFAVAEDPTEMEGFIVSFGLDGSGQADEIKYLKVEEGKIVTKTLNDKSFKEEDDAYQIKIVFSTISDFKDAIFKKTTIDKTKINPQKVYEVLYSYKSTFLGIKAIQNKIKGYYSTAMKAIKAVAQTRKYDSDNKVDEKEKRAYRQSIKMVNLFNIYNINMVTLFFSISMTDFNQAYKIAKKMIKVGGGGSSSSNSSDNKADEVAQEMARTFGF